MISHMKILFPFVLVVVIVTALGCGTSSDDESAADASASSPGFIGESVSQQSRDFDAEDPAAFNGSKTASAAAIAPPMAPAPCLRQDPVPGVRRARPAFRHALTPHLALAMVTTVSTRLANSCQVAGTSRPSCSRTESSFARWT